MENINDCYELIKLIANKNQQGFLSPAQFNRAWDSAELQRFTELNNPPAQYQPGRPIALLAYGMTRKVNDDLDRFVAREEFKPTAQVTYWVRPKGMVHAVSLLAEFEEELVDVEEIAHAELGSRLRNSIIAPSLEYPVVTFGAGQMEVYPPVVPRVLITYLRYPVPGQWVGGAANGRLVYNHLKSQQPEWPRDVWNDLCIRALAFLGINLKAPDVQQFAELKKAQGI